MRLELVGWEALLVLALLNLGVLGQVLPEPVAKGGHESTVNIPSTTTPETCESKTINYITHTLPQQCLRTSWTSSPPSDEPQTTDAAGMGGPAPSATGDPSPGNATASPESSTEQKQDPEATKEGAPPAGPEAQDAADAQEELATSSFMSFEEWKAMMLQKSGQDPTDLKGRKQREHRTDRDPGMGNGDLDSLGDDGEISLDFDALSDKVTELTASQPSGSSPPDGVESPEEQVFYDDGKTQYYRSKDAGKTCKERFSYASFDAGATVLKTSKDAKNAKAILVENKDSYMLLECHTKNKFVIVELSDDILIDTVVLSNFEFFSSMIRKFKVSVSARYPVKLDKWVDLGTFEARNSRDIQPFLVEHPQIYTKYLRIEFLSHYGNEYYCPVSLLRVHGTRMLDAWKESEGDDVEETIDGPALETAANTSQATEPTTESSQPSNVTDQGSQHMQFDVEMGLSPWSPPFQFDPSRETCATGSPTTTHPTSESPSPADGETLTPSTTTQPPAADQSPTSQADGSSSQAAAETSSPMGAASTVVPPPPSTSSPSTKVDTDNNNTASNVSVAQPPTKTNTTDPTAQTHHSTSKNKTSTSTSQSSSPTVQESFFKTVTKRLQFLESNTSLSLQYIEDQSRFLQEALKKMEKRQISRVDTFLGTLNATVLTELRNVRTQYDQIWQSTVIALESQREQSQREIVALSSRLSLLADEVVFQKRMAILQSVLLLSCLILVIFSRGYVGSNLELALHQQQLQQQQQRRHYRQGSNHEEPLSPSPTPSPRIHSGGYSMRSAPAVDKTLPLTPSSAYARSRGTTPSINDKGLDLDDVPEMDYSDETPSPQAGVKTRREHESETADNSAPEGDAPPSRAHARGDVLGVHGDTVSLGSSSSRSTLSQRKPLPALPEDPPEDPS